MIRGVFGSRHYPDLAAVERLVRSFEAGTTVVSGGAPGVDLRAEGTAYRLRFPIDSWRVEELLTEPGVLLVVRYQWPGEGVPQATIQPQRWPYVRGNRDDRRRAFGAAAYWRNGVMADIVDLGDCFHDGSSPGTRNMIRLLSDRGKLQPVHYPAGFAGPGRQPTVRGMR